MGKIEEKDTLGKTFNPLASPVLWATGLLISTILTAHNLFIDAPDVVTSSAVISLALATIGLSISLGVNKNTLTAQKAQPKRQALDLNTYLENIDNAPYILSLPDTQIAALEKQLLLKEIADQKTLDLKELADFQPPEEPLGGDYNELFL